ncbi:MAG TPA: hypothetical protein VNW68_03115, partial [Candidatus Limnocylindria bacterium]|nr:hypothetical protein [Candidatus Limnocylindria bacterium]
VAQVPPIRELEPLADVPYELISRATSPGSSGVAGAAGEGVGIVGDGDGVEGGPVGLATGPRVGDGGGGATAVGVGLGDDAGLPPRRTTPAVTATASSRPPMSRASSGLFELPGGGGGA